MKRFFSILLAAMIALGCLSITSGAMANGQSTIKVRLVSIDSVTGKTLGSIGLELWKVTKDPNSKAESWDFVKKITTGSTGKKTVTLDIGTTYRVSVCKAPSGYSEWTTTEFTTLIPNSRNGVTQTINVKVVPVHTEKIKVVDSNGKIVKNAKVTVYGAGFNATRWYSAKTNSSGIATIKGVEHGSRKIEVYVTSGGTLYKAYSGKIKITKDGTKTIKLPAKSKWTKCMPIRN